MKDAEDEAFDELARRQGAWGGGYRAKRAAAADKLQEPIYNVTVFDNAYPKGIPLEDWVQPPKRPWVGLTDQESIDIIKKDNNYLYPIQLLQAVMDALKAKNS